MSRRKSWKVVVAFSGLLLLASWTPVSARPLAATAHGQPPGLFATLWSSLVSLWGAAGCEIDPSGKSACFQASAGPAGAGGGNGGLASLRGAAGCQLDPNGKPACFQSSAGRPEAGRLGAGASSSLHRQ